MDARVEKVNNETELFMPVKELLAVAHRHGTVFNTDAVQATGNVPVDVQAICADFLTFTAHRFHGPKGICSPYVRVGVDVVQLLHGGEQMGGLRSGTLNITAIVGMAAGMRTSTDFMAAENEFRSLRDRLEDALTGIPDMLIDMLDCGQESMKGQSQTDVYVTAAASLGTLLEREEEYFKKLGEAVDLGGRTSL